MFTGAQFPARPYPGTRPDCSFAHDDGRGGRCGGPTVGGSAPDLAYAARRPLLVDGAVVRCSDVPQQVAAALEGPVADGDGLHDEVV